YENEAVLKQLPRLGGHLVVAEQVVRWQQPAPAHAELRIALRRVDTLDQLHAGPYTTRILPAAARSAKPLSENGACGYHPAFFFLELTLQRTRLPRRAHTNRDERSQKVCRDGQPGPLRDAVYAAHELDPSPRPDDPGEQVGQGLIGSLDPRRNDPGRDHRRLEQAQVVARKIEYLGQHGDLNRRPQVHTGQPEYR